LREVGALSALEGVSPADLGPFIAEIRHFWTVDDQLVQSQVSATGWSYTEASLLEAGGKATEGFPNVLPRLLPHLDGLGERLASGGAFLDVGTGVGCLSIAMARRFPSLQVVGIDAWAPALALARKNVGDAGLTQRIELREQPGEDLPDERAFDLGWIPAPFIPPTVLDRVAQRVHRALRPGGWVLLAVAKPGEGLRGAALDFRVALWGGRPMTQAEAERVLVDAGLTQVKTLPGPPRDFKMIVAGRRAG
jgi:SAM-dependent methyltransferase